MVSFFSLKSDSAPPWMVLAVLWCSMAQTLLLPSFIWSCERYRADVRTVWEQCVAIMSEEDGDDGQRRDRALAFPGAWTPSSAHFYQPFSVWGWATLECPLLDGTRATLGLTPGSLFPNHATRCAPAHCFLLYWELPPLGVGSPLEAHTTQLCLHSPGRVPEKQARVLTQP